MANPLHASEKTTLELKRLPVATVKQAETLMAGVAEVDITPPPGAPLAGHSTWSNLSVGVRTRLKARAYYLKAPNAPGIALVQLDLLSGELMLHHRVAELIAEKTDVTLPRLNLSGTHTHGGPGQYHSSNAYNIFSSSQMGFDVEIFDFLSEQIANAVIEAFNNQRPAKVATGAIEVWGSTRNRALDPYLANPENKQQSASKQKKFHAINPDLFMVRIDGLADDGIYYPMGAFSTFSIHGTGVLTKEMELVNGDVWSYISQTLETQAEAFYSPPWSIIHGAVEGTNGDIAPNATREMMGFMEAKRIGTDIGNKAWELFHDLGKELSSDTVIQMGAREINVLESPEIQEVAVCESAAFSTAQTAGPDEHSSYLLYEIPPFKRGWPKKYFQDCQGEKNIIGSFLQKLVLEPQDFPHHLMVQATRINDLLLVSVPFEVTVMAGVRIEHDLRQFLTEDRTAQKNIKHIAIGSVANGYFGYAVTPEEYKLQWYEGGSTLYGPNTLPFLSQHVNEVVTKVLTDGTLDEMPNSWQFELISGSFLPQPTSAKHTEKKPLRANASDPEFFDAAINQEAYWRWQWWDHPPAHIDLHRAFISVEYSTDKKTWAPYQIHNILVNDEGYDIAVIYLQEDEQARGLYEVRWYNPNFAPPTQFRFRVEPRESDETFYSEPFF